MVFRKDNVSKSAPAKGILGTDQMITSTVINGRGWVPFRHSGANDPRPKNMVDGDMAELVLQTGFWQCGPSLLLFGWMVGLFL